MVTVPISARYTERLQIALFSFAEICANEQPRPQFGLLQDMGCRSAASLSVAGHYIDERLLNLWRGMDQSVIDSATDKWRGRLQAIVEQYQYAV